jgi:dolichol kinase
MSLTTVAIMAVVSGLIAGLAETLSGLVDDNFTIPLVSAWSLTALAGLLGVGTVF